MIESRIAILFLVAAIAVIAAPGPDILYVLARGLSGGKRIGCISAVGIASGEVLHTLLAVFGLAALLQASAKGFLIVKLAGAFYLVYLGVRMFRDRNHFDVPQSLAPSSNWRAFRQGVLTNLFNPKAILFYVTFLPQFVNMGRGHAQLQLMVLGLTFAILDVTFLAVLALTAGHFNTWLIRKPKNAEPLRFATGSLLVALGVRLAFTERN